MSKRIKESVIGTGVDYVGYTDQEGVTRFFVEKNIMLSNDE